MKLRLLALIFMMALSLTLVACQEDEPTVPTEPTVVTTEPTVVPTEPTVVPTEPTVVPTEPTVVPTEPTVPVVETWTGYDMTVAATETDVTITYANTPATWWNNNAQLSNIVFDGANDTIVFTFTGVADQVYLFKIEGGGNARELAATATGSEQVLELSVSQLTETQRDGLNLIVVFSQSVGASGTLVIHSINYVASGEPTVPVVETWTGFNMTVAETENDVNITYANNPANWWENNAQLSNIVFDGTNDTVVFTFTGVADQSYVFKIEGGGINVEQQNIVATGSEQVFELSVAQFTEVQRAGLNLIVIFAQTEGASGTLVIHSIGYIKK